MSIQEVYVWDFSEVGNHSVSKVETKKIRVLSESPFSKISFFSGLKEKSINAHYQASGQNLDIYRKAISGLSLFKILEAFYEFEHA